MSEAQVRQLQTEHEALRAELEMLEVASAAARCRAAWIPHAHCALHARRGSLTLSLCTPQHADKPEACAKKIIDYIEATPEPDASENEYISKGGSGTCCTVM